MFAATVTNHDDLIRILKLEDENLIQQISDEEMRVEGFVTMKFSLDVLHAMHKIAPSIVIKDNDKVVAYALTMLRECRGLFEPLEPMFTSFDTLQWKNKPLSDYNFYIMGQICVAKEYRSRGLVEMLYEKHKEVYSPKFENIITEISTRNHRSLRAHKRIGFETIHTHRDDLDEWNVVLWNWK